MADHNTAQGTKSRLTVRVTISGGNCSYVSKLLGFYGPARHAKIDKYDLKIESSVR